MRNLDGITVEQCIKTIVNVATAPRRARGDEPADDGQIIYEITMSNAGYFMLAGLGFTADEIIELLETRDA